MKKVLLIAILAVFAVSCNKDQAAVKKLDGSWNVTKYLVSEDGITLDYIAFGATANFIFDGCKLKDNEYCNLTTVVTFDGSTETMTQLYKVTGDGTVLEVKESGTTSISTTFNITELTKDILKITQVEDGVTSNLELSKM